MIQARTRRTTSIVCRGLAATVMLTIFLATVNPEKGLAQDKRIRWKMASSFAASLPILGSSGMYFTKRLQQATNGRMRIKFFDPGKLVPGLEVFEAVSTGGVQAGYAAAGFWIGKIAAAAIFGAVPFGPDTNEYLAWIFEGGGLQLWRGLYAKHDLVPFPCGILPPEASGWFRTPIDSAEQLQGLKMRFYGLGGKAMQKLGMSIQLLAPGDIFTALDRGVLDATEFSMPAIDEKLGFYQIAKHYYFPGWHQQASFLELLVNKKSWDSLTKTDQILIEMACRDTILNSITEGETLQGPALERMKAKGVEIHEWSPEMLAKFEQATREVIQEEAQKDPEFARVWDSLSKFRQNYAEWRRLSRLLQ
jgi:TRAP-type mannitol/chloroaromatic compound transport system substrate-binding protein